MKASVFDIHEKRCEDIDSCDYSHGSSSSDHEDSSDLDDMTVQINDADMEDRSAGVSKRSLSINPMLSKKDMIQADIGIYETKQLTNIERQNSIPSVSDSGSLASKMSDPMMSPLEVIFIRKIPLANLRKIAIANLKHENFVRRIKIISNQQNTSHCINSVNNDKFKQFLSGELDSFFILESKTEESLLSCNENVNFVKIEQSKNMSKRLYKMPYFLIPDVYSIQLIAGDLGKDDHLKRGQQKKCLLINFT